MIQSTQRKMLRLIIQTQRRYKKIVKRKGETNEEKDTDDLSSTGDESEDGQSSNTHNDQDSDVSFETDTDEETDTTEIEEEDWIEYIKKEAQTTSWKRWRIRRFDAGNKTHKKMKRRLALRMATSPSERWLMKAAEWNPELSLRLPAEANSRAQAPCKEDSPHRHVLENQKNTKRRAMSSITDLISVDPVVRSIPRAL